MSNKWRGIAGARGFQIVLREPTPRTVIARIQTYPAYFAPYRPGDSIEVMEFDPPVEVSATSFDEALAVATEWLENNHGDVRLMQAE